MDICVLDTGSEDRTVSIARRHVANIKIYTGCNNERNQMEDFSDARNACLSMVKTGWILWIDADEILEDPGCRLKSHAIRDDISGLRIRVQSGETRWHSLRFFRRMPTHRFVGKVHEFVTVSGTIDIEPAVAIHNFPNKKGKESALRRDFRLCTLALKDNPNDTRMIFYLARALQGMNRYSDAILEYRRYLQLERRFTAGRHAAVFEMAVCYLFQRKWAQCIRLAKAAVHLEPRLAEAHCLIGDAYMAVSHIERAKKWYKSAMSCTLPPVYPLFVCESFYYSYPAKQLARLRKLSAK